MSKKNVTYVDAARFEQAIVKAGLEMQAQAGFVKVLGPKGRQVYVAKTKRVARVDISGFEMPADTEGVIALGGDSFGNVKQQLDFSRGEDAILATFEAILAHMKTLAPVEKVARTKPEGAKVEAQGWSSNIPAAPAKSLAEKVAPKVRKAAEKNA